MKIIRFVLFLLFFSQVCFGKDNIDSLLMSYKNSESNDSSYCELLYQLSLYYINNHPDSSLIFSRELISIANKRNDLYSTYRGYLQLGNAYRIKGKLDNAVNFYFKSFSAAKTNNYKKGQGIVYSALGDTYSNARNYTSSIIYYNKAIEILRSENDSIALAIALLNTGSEYSHTQNFDTALVYFRESATIFEKFNYKMGIGYCLGNIGKVFFERKNLPEAEKYISDAILILQNEGDNYSVGIYKRYLAGIYFKQNKISKAIKQGTESLKIASMSGLNAQIRDASDLLSQIYNDLGDYKNAYYYQSQYIAYRDSINNEETIRKMADLRTEYEVAQKQTEVEKAQTLLELETKRRQNQQIVGIGLIVVILLSGALSYLLFRNARRDRYINRLLREQKEELMTQRDMLEDVNNTKDRFFSIISHDLRGPIGVLNGTTMLIREFLESKDYAQLDDLTTNMEYSVKKVQNLLDNLLEWAVSQRGQYNYVAEKVELNQVMLETISIFSDMAQAKNIVISYEQKYSEAYITVDRNSLTTILRNLISNAIKFTNKCGVVDIVVEKDNSETQILVKDTGVGIPHDKLQTLFDIEAKKSTWGTAKEKGLGIGLNLVHEFVKMNKGDIQVRSTLGVGTTFIISFPTQHELVDAEKARTI